MICTMCKGDVKEVAKTYVTTLENECVVIIKKVPALVCQQCGETYYTDEVSDRLEEIIDTVREIRQEISVIEYTEVA